MKAIIEIDLRTFLKRLLITIFSVLSLVIIPIFILVFLFRYNLPSLHNIMQTYLFIISLGFLIIILSISLFKINPVSKIWLIISLSKEILYLFIILFWAITGKVNLKIENFEIFYDTSPLLLLFIAVPFLLAIKIVFDYLERRERIRQQLIILKIVKENIKLSSKWQIKKYLTDNYIEINNVSEIIEIISNNDPPLMKRKGSLRLTKDGIRYLEFYERKYFKDLDTFVKKPQEIPLQVWTEEDLKKHNLTK